ncbi:MAG: hypothetical protein ABJC66_07950 [Gammaproteobacteria bacterium]
MLRPGVYGAPGLLFSWAAFSMGTGALYAFSERIGKSIGLTPATIGLVLSAGLFVGLLGTAAAAFFGGHINRRRALVGGMAGSGMERLGYGAGAWIGGVLAEHAGYSVTGLLGFVGCVLGQVVGFPSLFRALEKRTSNPSRVPA